MQSRLGLVGLLLISSVGLAQSSLPPAPHRHTVTVSPPEVRGNEPSIAVNPSDPNQVVATFQPASIAYSTDGGQTFTPAELPPVVKAGEAAVMYRLRSPIAGTSFSPLFISTNSAARPIGVMALVETASSCVVLLMEGRPGTRMPWP